MPFPINALPQDVDPQALQEGELQAGREDDPSLKLLRLLAQTQYPSWAARAFPAQGVQPGGLPPGLLAQQAAAQMAQPKPPIQVQGEQPRVGLFAPALTPEQVQGMGGPNAPMPQPRALPQPAAPAPAPAPAPGALPPQPGVQAPAGGGPIPAQPGIQAQAPAGRPPVGVMGPRLPVGVPTADLPPVQGPGPQLPPLPWMGGASTPEQLNRMAELMKKFGPKTPEEMAQTGKEALLAQQGTQDLTKTKEEGASKERVAQIAAKSHTEALKAQHDLADKAILDNWIVQSEQAGRPKSPAQIAQMASKIAQARRAQASAMQANPNALPPLGVGGERLPVGVGNGPAGNGPPGAAAIEEPTEEDIGHALGTTFGVEPIFATGTGRATIPTTGTYRPDQVFKAMLSSNRVRQTPATFAERLLNEPGNPGLPQLTSDLANRLIYRLNESNQLTGGPGLMGWSGNPNRKIGQAPAPVTLPGGLKVEYKPVNGSMFPQYVVTSPQGHTLTLPHGNYASSWFPTFEKTRQKYAQEAEAVSPLLIELMGRRALGQ